MTVFQLYVIGLLVFAPFAFYVWYETVKFTYRLIFKYKSVSAHYGISEDRVILLALRVYLGAVAMIFIVMGLSGRLLEP